MRIVFVLLLSVLLFGCDKPTEPEVNYVVKYSVTGSTSKVSVTIENESGGTSQYSDVGVPWSYQFPSSKPKGTFVYIAAQNQNASGSVVVTITANGNLFKTSTSSGAYVIASASGSLGE